LGPGTKGRDVQEIYIALKSKVSITRLLSVARPLRNSSGRDTPVGITLLSSSEMGASPDAANRNRQPV